MDTALGISRVSVRAAGSLIPNRPSTLQVVTYMIPEPCSRWFTRSHKAPLHHAHLNPDAARKVNKDSLLLGSFLRHGGHVWTRGQYHMAMGRARTGTPIREVQAAAHGDSVTVPQQPPSSRLMGPSFWFWVYSAIAGLALFYVCCAFPLYAEEGNMVNVLFMWQVIGAAISRLFGEFKFALGELKKSSWLWPGLYQTRDARLPHDWHNLYDGREQRTYFYNSATGTAQWAPPALLTTSETAPRGSTTGQVVMSYIWRGVSQQLGGTLAPLITAGLNLCQADVAVALLTHKGLEPEVSMLIAACFAALPSPLPSPIYKLGSTPLQAYLNGSIAQTFETLLSVALAARLVSNLCSFLAVLMRAARVRAPFSDLSLDRRAFLRLLCALCPALSWRLHPWAFKLDRERIVLLPLPYNVPLPVWVPKWELIGRSWTALLYAAPMVLPLARLLAAAQPVKTSNFLSLVIDSRVVQISSFVSVVSFLLGRQKDAYTAAIEQHFAV